MSPILIRMKSFLEQSQASSTVIDEKLIVEFGETCKNILRKQFITGREGAFRLRMSNVGRPLCQLQLEKAGVPAENEPYNNIVKNTYGDLVEALLVFILKASGCNVQDEQIPADLIIGGIDLQGTADIEIDNMIYDIKSASDWSFKHKFGPECSFNTVAKDDAFGYVAQGFLYGWACVKPFGGWIVCNKVTGEINIIETPEHTEDIQKSVWDLVANNIIALVSKKDFKRCFEDVPEKFNRKETGNRYLGFVCSYCSRKNSCWDNLVYCPQPASESKNPKWYYYTHRENT